jgi:hypothetical protein
MVGSQAEHMADACRAFDQRENASGRFIVALKVAVICNGIEAAGFGRLWKAQAERLLLIAREVGATPRPSATGMRL